MTFANVSVNHEQLTLLSQLLLTAFPGCTIHQSHDPARAMHHLSSGKIDAVFADADTCAGYLQILKNQKSTPSIFLLCRQDRQLPEGSADVQGIVTYPITTQKIKLALQTKPQELREVV